MLLLYNSGWHGPWIECRNQSNVCRLLFALFEHAKPEEGSRR